MTTYKLGLLLAGIILLQSSNMAFAADAEVTPLAKKEIRFETSKDRASYEKHLFRNDVRNKPFGHLLKYAGTGNITAVLSDPQVHFNLSMLLGNKLDRLFENLKAHKIIDFYNGGLIITGIDPENRGDESAQLWVSLYHGGVEAVINSGGVTNVYSMYKTASITHQVAEYLHRNAIEKLIKTAPMVDLRLVSRSVRGKFGHLTKFLGTENIASFVNDPEMLRSLRQLLGDKLTILLRNLGMHRSVDTFSGWMRIVGGRPHEMLEERGEIAIDPYGGRLEAAILSDETWTVYSSAQRYEDLSIQIKHAIHLKAIWKLMSQTPETKFRIYFWQPKGDHDVDQY